MTGHRAVIGLSLLSALLLGALAAQSASAALTTSKNTTAHTCIKVEIPKTGDFEDAHCDKTHPEKKGEFTHQLIKIGETTTIDGTNNEVTESTKKSEPALLKGEIVGAGKLELECTTVKNNTTNSWIRNAEPAAGQHTLEGFVETEFSNCNVKLLKNCTVEEPIVTKANVHGVEGLEGPKAEKNAMGVEFVGAGANETFVELGFLGVSCPIKTPTTFPIKGKVIATNGPTTESAQENRETGATLVFTPKFKMQELTLGGKVAEFSTIATAKMPGGNPISATTTTP